LRPQNTGGNQSEKEQQCILFHGELFSKLIRQANAKRVKSLKGYATHSFNEL
jgi:hypothetical protein